MTPLELDILVIVVHLVVVVFIVINLKNCVVKICYLLKKIGNLFKLKFKTYWKLLETLETYRKLYIGNFWKLIGNLLETFRNLSETFRNLSELLET